MTAKDMFASVDLDEHRQGLRDAGLVRGVFDYIRGTRVDKNPYSGSEPAERDGWETGWENAALYDLLTRTRHDTERTTP